MKLNSWLNFRALPSPCLLTGLCLATLPAQAANDTWNQLAAGTYPWNEPTNWVSGTQFPNNIDDVASLNVNLTGANVIELNAAITVGTLNLTDTTTPFFATTINAGTAGSLNFDVTTGTANLNRLNAANPGVTDLIQAPVTLSDPLRVTLPFIGSANGIRLTGAVTGSGGVNVVAPAVPGAAASIGQFIELANPANTFAGTVEVGNGVIVYRGNVPSAANSALGNSSAAVLLTGPSSLVGTGTPTFANNVTAELRLIANDDTSSHTFDRPLDASTSTGTAAQSGRARFSFHGDGGVTAGANGLNTNTLTFTGPVTLASNSRGTEFLAGRQGMTIRFTNTINSGTGTAGTIYWGPNAPGALTADGRTNGIYRFSDLPRSYTNGQNLTHGTMIIEGSVGALNTDSPIGRTTISLGDGSGGNIFSPNTDGANRRLFLEAPGSSIARTLSPGGGGSANLGTATNINGVLPAVFQPLYGNSGNLTTFNGYEIGGKNTSGTVTYLNGFTMGTIFVPATGTAGRSSGTNPFTIVHNIALSAVAGGTVSFNGVINGNTTPPITDDATPGAAVSGNSARITINQFRNHPNLDANVDGIPDAGANQLVGSPTTGTVILAAANTYNGGTEVLGGTLLCNNTTGSATGPSAVTVRAGAILGGNGTITGPLLTQGTLAPGALTESTGTLNVANTEITGTLAITINGTAADALAVNGTLFLNDTTLTVTELAGGFTQPFYTIATYSGALTGAFVNVPVGYQVSYNQGTLANEIRLSKSTSGYTTWAAGFNLTGNDALETADSDHDGIANLLEYLLGGNPTLSDANKAPQLSSGSGTISLTFTRSDLSESDTSLKLQMGTTLGSWPDEITIGAGSGSSGTTQWEVTENGTADDAIVITFPVDANLKKFARLKVVR
jgi:autotransporter-associated beta strand protein